MAKPNLAIPINPDLGNQAQAVCNGRGLDIVTVIDYILQQIVHNKDAVSFESVKIDFTNMTPPARPIKLVETEESREEVLFRLYASDSNSLFDFSNIKGKPGKLGGWEGRIKMADDFNAPIDDFEEYM